MSSCPLIRSLIIKGPDIYGELHRVMPDVEWPKHGWGNGYALIPPEHPAFADEELDDRVSVHGGITWDQVVHDLGMMSEFDLAQLDPPVLGYRMVGFDTSHAYSRSSVWTEERVRQEAEHLVAQIESLYSGG